MAVSVSSAVINESKLRGIGKLHVNPLLNFNQLHRTRIAGR